MNTQRSALLTAPNTPDAGALSVSLMKYTHAA
jgi:hypothetical protein